MKFIVSSSELLKSLNQIGGVINTSNTLPILDCFLFELHSNELKITGSDLETTMNIVCQVESEDEGKLAIPSKMLLDTLKTFPSQPLTFVKKDDSNVIEMISEQGKYQLATDDPEEFPQTVEVSDAQEVKLSSSVLVEAIDKTIFATANDELRPVMNGVFFEFGSQLNFVATDAHRLVKYSRKDFSGDEINFILPKKPLNLLKNSLASADAEVTLEYNDTNALLSFGNTQLVCRLVEGKYPNYDAVIPKDNPNLLTVNRTLLLNSLKRVAIFSNKSTNLVRFKISGQSLDISGEDNDFSSKAQENVVCDYNGEDMQIGFNSKLMIEMLTHLVSEDIYIELSEPNRAGIIKPVDGLDEGEEILMLVMPLMLNA